MKKLSYFLGLVAMAVMMTMTSCSNVNEEVQKVCDALEKAADAVEEAKSEKDIATAVQEAGESVKQVKKETELTEDDKEALKESFMNYIKTALNKLPELGIGDASKTEEQIKQAEDKLDKMLEESKTLGDFIEKLKL